VHYRCIGTLGKDGVTFNVRIRREGNSIRTYVADLLSVHCNYGETLEAMLRDTLVVGIKDGRIQRRILAAPGLNFKKAMEIATEIETTAKNVKEIQSEKGITATHKVLRNSERVKHGRLRKGMLLMWWHIQRSEERRVGERV